MTDVQTKAKIAGLGTRESNIKIRTSVLCTAALNSTHQTAVTFDRAFTVTPDCFGVVIGSDGASLGSAAVSNLSATGMSVNIHQPRTVDVASGTHYVDVYLSGIRVNA